MFVLMHIRPISRYMSISLGLINKNKRISVTEIIDSYVNSLNSVFVNSELESFVYSKEKGVVSLLFEGNVANFNTQDAGLLIQTDNILDREITTIKVVHENSYKSRQNLSNRLSFLKRLECGFVLLEHTALIDDVSKRPPRKTTNGNLYLPVGAITTYFNPDSTDSRYANDRRGVDFRESVDSPDIITTTDLYYSSFIDNKNLDGLTAPDQCGLQHFTTVVHNVDGKLNISFLQNQNAKLARYFFEPEIVFCSNDFILRTFRGIRYPQQEISLKNNLRKASFEV